MLIVLRYRGVVLLRITRALRLDKGCLNLVLLILDRIV
jgi:hypothetical protein